MSGLEGVCIGGGYGGNVISLRICGKIDSSRYRKKEWDTYYWVKGKRAFSGNITGTGEENCWLTSIIKKDTGRIKKKKRKKSLSGPCKSKITKKKTEEFRKKKKKILRKRDSSTK